ncbi:uncharacterized protein LOC123322556 [Coccinella septempunctata]|uniref:uncharacterized protein LOC123322556 n=1 Tax=Coccinella septempunctata TaxID=41139 RepID=UPI001D07B666|nr:uncharacterized protein LOC123322556 [Coccinella septempunctata]
MLALGSKFSIPVSANQIPIYKLITDVEDLIQKVPTERRDFLRGKTTSIITNFIHNNSNKNYTTERLFNVTKSFLRDNEELIVLNSDKGSVTVIMEKQDYVQKMLAIINSNSFKELPMDPTQKIQTKCNKFVSLLETHKVITREKARQMRTYNSNTPKIYGNPKIHKPDTPLRPIVSCIQAPTRYLSGYVAEILSMAYDKDNEYFIKDSFEFADLVNNLKVPPDHVVISLDVVNLFGNIQSELAIEAISKKWNVIQEYTNIPKQLFMDILNFLMENSYFSFQGKFYLQIFGSSMGSDLSPIISLYVMDYLLDGTVAKLPFKLFLIKKYVDDLLLIAPANEITNIKTTCNSFNEHIQFTVEEEDENHSVPFLDTKVCRINNTIKLDWYRKDITSDKFIHYLSDHPIKTKINTIKGMRTRVDRICHPDFRQINSNKLFKIFVENGYPRSMLRKLLFESATSRMNEVEEVNVPSQNNEIDEIKYGSIMNINVKIYI